MRTLTSSRQMLVDLRAVDQPEFEARGLGDAFGHVQVGREIVALGEDDAPPRRIGPLQRGRGAQHLEAVERGRVADADLAGVGADEAGDLVADAPREVDPASAVPAADQALAPLALGDFGQARGGPTRQRAERIAVQVDDAFGEDELVAQRRERIGAVEGRAVLAAHGRRRGVGNRFHRRHDGSTGAARAVSVNSHTTRERHAAKPAPT